MSICIVDIRAHDYYNITVSSNKGRGTVQNEGEPGKGEPFKTIVNTIMQTCEGCGWSSKIEAYDKINYSTASINIVRMLDFLYVSALITVIIEDNGRVRYRIEPISSYSYGLDSLSIAIGSALDQKGWRKPQVEQPQCKTSNLDILLQIFKRFHNSVLQLSTRHDNRQTLKVQDEYDVQDYLYAILKKFFDDIRPEEYVPSYAGSSSKVDFLLKDEKTVVETKYSSPKLKDKKIGEQLIIDIERYKNHPDCDNLICFVYNPDLCIKNPYGIERDLSGERDKLTVKVFVYPK